MLQSNEVSSKQVGVADNCDFWKIYLRAATRTATVITRTDGKALTPELAGVVGNSEVDGGKVTDGDACPSVEAVVVELPGGTLAEAVAEGVTVIVVALQ